MGVPFRGTAAIGAAAVFASQGKLNIAAVLIVAVIGNEVGGLLGYKIGDRWGRRILEHPGPALELPSCPGSPSGGGRTGFSLQSWAGRPSEVLVIPSPDLGGHEDKDGNRDHRRAEGHHSCHRVLAHRENEAADQSLRAFLRGPERSG